MNALDVLKYGHQTVLEAIDGIPEADWYIEGVCGIWSIKDTIVHLASFEYLLIDVLQSFLSDGPTPILDRFIADAQQFNDDEVGWRRDKTVQEIWDEYKAAYELTLALMAQIPINTRRTNGTLPWYGAKYSLEDFIVYTFYGHKREHSAHINVFHDQLAAITIQASLELRPEVVS